MYIRKPFSGFVLLSLANASFTGHERRYLARRPSLAAFVRRKRAQRRAKAS